ncbi:MAG: hypothetical protein ABIQ31_27255 [Ferruginibacter sp.]
MKVSKTLIQAMLVAVTAGLISSCEKPGVDAGKKVPTEKSKTTSYPDNCPACGMG